MWVRKTERIFAIKRYMAGAASSDSIPGHKKDKHLEQKYMGIFNDVFVFTELQSVSTKTQSI